jgi:hypothetical protein
LYAATDNDSAISGFALGSTTGTLREIAGSPFAEHRNTDCTELITGLAAEPTGRFLYAGTGLATISIFAINAGNGALRHIKDTSPKYAHYSGDGVLQVDPSGSYLYTFGDSNLPGHNPLDEVIGFAINLSTGDLRALPSSPFKIQTDLAQGFGPVVTP